VAPNPVDRTSHNSLSSASSLSTAQVDNMSISASPLLKVEYVQSSNKALVEKFVLHLNLMRRNSVHLN